MHVGKLSGNGRATLPASEQSGEREIVSFFGMARLGSCSQSYLREDLLTEQLKTEISKVALCEDWKEKMLAQVEVWEKENIQSSQSFAQNLEKGDNGKNGGLIMLRWLIRIN